jgi:predicted Zn-dependent peptidase
MYRKTVLQNGIRIVTEKLEHSCALSLGIWVSVGSRDEVEKESGISHFIEHMIFKGTEARDSLRIAKELDAIGGFSNAFTGKEYTCFHAKVLDKHFPILADILSDIFLHSIFNTQDIKREKQVIFQEIRMVDDSPEEYIHDMFQAQFWLNHPLGRSILEQVHIILGGKAPHLLSDARFASALFNTILGGNMSSRLFQEIREKMGLAYSIYSFLSEYIDAGLLGVCVATDTSQVNNVLQITNREIKKIQKGDISQADLLAAREHLIGAILLSSENTDTRMMRIAKNECVFGRYISYEELVERLEKVTVDDVVHCAQEIFKSDVVSLATLGPFNQTELDPENLQF